MWVQGGVRRGAELEEEERDRDSADARSGHVRDAPWLARWTQCAVFMYIEVG